MELSSSVYVSNPARVPDFQALGGFGSKSDGRSEQVSFCFAIFSHLLRAAVTAIRQPSSQFSCDSLQKLKRQESIFEAAREVEVVYVT
jgi:hypothetical protein